MTDETHQDLIDALDDLLGREREALLGGKLEQIAKLMSAKEDLVDRFNALPPEDRPTLESVHQKVTRNQALLNSALDGIRAVANRMADLRRVRSGLETYDRRGNKQTFGTQTSTNVEKRA
ncbi:flagellar biosynthesis protein FlgN [Sedimentitalea todarodis]|uniref:Flagellar biosynthesis protein FlgN n=1 Tax=Sedimentitalea todarodis TaxID=1631240 RepID=A0ABU3VAL6_9RHOB|nr:flagellar biosynthesis protein FlgN [Sedimentitalea todarodis]MDU9003085.1 flagellar biosynthesis protein FlgN [Sedimentitalea todarodis]